MTLQRRIARATLGLEDRLQLIEANLVVYYEEIRSDFAVGDLVTDILAPIDVWDDPSIDEPAEIIRQFVQWEARTWSAEQLTGSPMSALVVTATYCCRARDVLKDDYREAAAGQPKGRYRELAWVYLAEASFWCGVMLAGKGIDKAYRETVAEVTAEVAADVTMQAKKKNAEGGLKTAKLRQPAIDYAYKLVREEGADLGTLGVSPNKAALAITELVLKFAEHHKIELSRERADKTIADWLRKMPDAKDYLDMSKSREQQRMPR
ncbi:Uncharacterised protein [Burkholderia pseudomallei]|nr:Uncharacterised protein [Burkholderia pseudomallei]